MHPMDVRSSNLRFAITDSSENTALRNAPAFGPINESVLVLKAHRHTTAVPSIMIGRAVRHAHCLSTVNLDTDLTKLMMRVPRSF